MKWLLWKEYRQNRLIVFTLLFLLVLPHLCGLYAMWWSWMYRPKLDGESYVAILMVASIYSFALSQIALALIGGNVIAGERVDRSAEFQAYLPISRKRILEGKILISLVIAGVIWLTNPLLMGSLFLSIGRGHANSDVPVFFQILINIAITGLTFFGVAWLFSSILNSPIFSIVAGLITPLIIWSITMYINYLFFEDRWDSPALKVMEYVYRGTCLTISPLCFGIGSWLYLRRVEP